MIERGLIITRVWGGRKNRRQSSTERMQKMHSVAYPDARKRYNPGERKANLKSTPGRRKPTKARDRLCQQLKNYHQELPPAGSQIRAYSIACRTLPTRGMQARGPGAASPWAPGQGQPPPRQTLRVLQEEPHRGSARSTESPSARGPRSRIMLLLSL